MGELKSTAANVIPDGSALPTTFDPARRGASGRAMGRNLKQNARSLVSLVLGGVRSGKSRYAQSMAERVHDVVFLATASAVDDEMRLRIEQHRTERPAHWSTVEEPLELAASIRSFGPAADLILIDCLTIFAATLLESRGSEPARLNDTIDDLCRVLTTPPCSIVLVSNEVGSGIVPAYPLGRRYRDLLGEINQRVAQVAGQVILMVAGIPLTLKAAAGQSGPFQ